MSSSVDFTNDERFDGLYLQVANTARGIEPMLDTVFSFLRRKTDFFNGPNGTEGSDMAIQTVNRVLQKHVALYEKKKKKEEEEEERKKAAAVAELRRKKQKKKAAAEEQEKSRKEQQQDQKLKQPNKAEDDDDEDVIELGEDGFDIPLTNSEKTAPQDPAPAPAPASPRTETETDTTTTADDADADATNDNDNDKKHEEESTKPNIGNGGTVEGKYVWTQTLQEVNVTIPLPDNTRGRDLNVSIQKKHLKVSLKNNNNNNNNFILNAPLTKPIICDDSFWTVEDGNRLVCNLQKLNQVEWWEGVCVGDDTIDVKKVQPENSKLDDLDGETRQTVEKMMFDQRQKAMGLPSSDEQRKQDMFEKFKKAHPEMDFSNAKMS